VLDQPRRGFGWSTACRAGETRDGDWLGRLWLRRGPATRPTSRLRPARLSLTLRSNHWLAGHESATELHDGAITVAGSLGIDVKDVTVRLADSDLPPVTIAGGSNNAASTTLVPVEGVRSAPAPRCRVRRSGRGQPFHGAEPGVLDPRGRQAHARTDGKRPLRTAVRPHGWLLESMPGTCRRASHAAAAGLSRAGYSFCAAQEAQRRCSPLLRRPFRRVRVPRHDPGSARAARQSRFAAGTIINPMTPTASTWPGDLGLSSRLHEGTEVDPVSARIINNKSRRLPWCR